MNHPHPFVNNGNGMCSVCGFSAANMFHSAIHPEVREAEAR